MVGTKYLKDEYPTHHPFIFNQGELIYHIFIIQNFIFHLISIPKKCFNYSTTDSIHF